MNSLSVSELNKYIKALMLSDILLSNLWINGELSNFKYYPSGHMYFTLKDTECSLRCVMFKMQNETLTFTPQNGMKVLVYGYISVFERDGTYQFYAQSMLVDGIGDLYTAFMQLKHRLQLEGLFNDEHKRALPFLPSAIGIVTSNSGAVIHDILKILNRKFYNFHAKIYPVAVQGCLAASQVSLAIKQFNKLKNVDVIILARGGGSIEDLWAFNEEIVARAIYASHIPVVSAIGHETDYTIADFVSDVRAPTPSAAAELVIPDKNSLQQQLYSAKKQLLYSMSNYISTKRINLEQYIKNQLLVHQYKKVDLEKLRLSELKKHLSKAIITYLDKTKLQVQLFKCKLDSFSPLHTLNRGFCIAYDEKTNGIIKGIQDLHIGDKVFLHLKDGQAICIVKKIASNYKKVTD